MFKSVVMSSGVRQVMIRSGNVYQSVVRRQLASSSSDGNKSGDDSLTNELLSDLKRPSDESVANKETNRLSFAKAFEKFVTISKERQNGGKDSASDEPSVPFPTLLRHSTFIQMGDPEGKVVIGRIDDVVDEDLYVDFGFKFNGVCKRPKSNQSQYVRGAKVKVRINDLELSDRFLGSSIDMTLLEADITLMGIVWSPARSTATDQRVDQNVDI
ncbi:unnamed protein product [Medioppia subpectinata]|uniref:Mitochondrial ribosomal protein S28 n=1 Tax=Medioppia subpectinata TaxID=1979941 RepID=A0A7R9Q0R4_9ACAR|nr:unnamed protein product [Medioppia subpectinata]CAG2108241.1 unnamed protein product [Medioppia subpectinata]